MTQVHTSVDHRHLGGRKYEIIVDQYHRPAQIHRDTNVCVDVGEVNLENACEYDLRYVPIGMRDRLRAIMGDELADRVNFNDLLDVVIATVENNDDVKHVAKVNAEHHFNVNQAVT